MYCVSGSTVNNVHLYIKHKTIYMSLNAQAQDVMYSRTFIAGAGEVKYCHSLDFSYNYEYIYYTIVTH